MITTVKYGELKNYINGEFIEHQGEFASVVSPIDGNLIAKVPLSSTQQLDNAVLKAKEAFAQWREITIKDRAQIFYKFKTLLEQNINELAEIVRDENGKTLEEAIASILKGIEVTEFACSIPQLTNGEVLEVSRGVECKLIKRPLGVVASITPFNFPLMVPLWTIPNAILLGNCMILKPSERVPVASGKIAELLKQAGLPDGVFNIVHGGSDIVEAICDHPDIAALSFVGSTKIAKIVYKRATSNNKRALCLGGAKNHLVVLPDANPDMTANNVAASMAGNAGQRCMAASVMVAVGDVDHIIEKLCIESKKFIPGDNLGPVITQESKLRIENYITEAERSGAKILLDGRNTVVAGKEKGFYVGPTVIDYVTPDMSVAKEEIFGPVLSIIRVNTLDEAIELENNSSYGNGAAIFTQSGGLANYFAERASAGMIGINVGVPVPREPFSFGGWNDSKFGVGDITGKSSIEFWTQPKKITTKWNPESRTGWMS